jgi:hypothetical protein
METRTHTPPLLTRPACKWEGAGQVGRVEMLSRKIPPRTPPALLRTQPAERGARFHQQGEGRGEAATRRCADLMRDWVGQPFTQRTNPGRFAGPPGRVPPRVIRTSIFLNWMTTKHTEHQFILMKPRSFRVFAGG